MKTFRIGGTTPSWLYGCAVLVAVAMAGVAGCSSSASNGAGSTASPPSTAAPYHSKDGYSISAPAGWIFHPSDGQNGVSSIFGAPTTDSAAKIPFVDNINVVITPADADLETAVAKSIQQGPSILPNYKVTTNEPTTADGHPAHLLGGTYDDGQAGPLENLQLIIVNGSKEYTISFTSTTENYSGQRDLAEASLNSFKFDK